MTVMTPPSTKRPSAARRLTAFAASAVVATAGLLFAGGTAHAAINPEHTTIWDDEPLFADWHLDNGPARLIMQKDGNLVSYVNGSPSWSSNTVGCGYKAVMQADGNLVVYAQDGRSCWASGTQRGSRSYPVKLFLDSSGSLAIYGDNGRWCHSTAPYKADLSCDVLWKS
ncbi:hypothetical protein [Streptomyces rectiverticillatus]|uniref:hypothetical protein n=1 Tax=Streptomyces rectiverticillatus TaxID=173860 RepID=UPI0015C2D455|nr:hypothetical protein [Streptomyces rectiverticillatus]